MHELFIGMSNVELKPEGFEKDNPEDALEQHVLDLIRKHGLNEALMLRSPLRKLLILLMVIILIDFKTTMISMS